MWSIVSIRGRQLTEKGPDGGGIQSFCHIILIPSLMSKAGKPL